MILASVLILSLLFGMLFTVLATTAYLLGFFEWYFLIILTLAVNFFIWLLSPYIADWIYRFFYHVEWIGIEGLKKRDPNIASFVESVCNSKKIKVPKIGIIKDDNPTAFAYGSAPFNSRIVFTEGLFTYLKSDEIKSVLAHEIGHIVHLDFIIMTMASVIVQLLFEVYVITRGGGRRKGGGAIFLAVAAISYIFYIIGTYIVLLLNRTREYYADEFSAEVTKNPNLLSNALIKISYGIIKNPERSEKEIRFLKSTRSLGIFDFKMAKTMGLVYLNSVKMKSWAPVEGAILFDMHNPWGWISELSSTHPLTGKRIRRLSNFAVKIGVKPLFDFNNLLTKYQVDKRKLYRNFFIDVFFHLLPVTIPLAVGGLLVSNFFTPNTLSGYTEQLPFFIGSLLASFGAGTLLRTLYTYSTRNKFEDTDIADIMDDIYTSSIKGRPIKFRGKIVGKGVPGYIFSEDMMFEDKTGIIYLNYENFIPLFGNLIFALTKTNKLIGKSCTVDGWFLRGLSHWIELNKIYVEGKEIRSYARALGIVISFLIVFAGLSVAFLL